MTAQNPCGYVVLIRRTVGRPGEMQLAAYDPRWGLYMTYRRGRCPAMFASDSLARKAIKRTQTRTPTLPWTFVVRMVDLVEAVP